MSEAFDNSSSGESVGPGKRIPSATAVAVYITAHTKGSVLLRQDFASFPALNERKI